MAFSGLQINKGNGNSNRSAENTNKVFLFVAGGVAASDLALNTPTRLVAIEQAEDLGINAAYDAANSVRVYADLSEIFRLDPEAEFIFALVAQPTSDFKWFEDAGIVEKLLRNPISKDVKAIFTSWNPASSYTPVYTAEGLEDSVLAEIPKAQAMITRFFGEFRYLDGVFLDGYSFEDLAKLEDLRTYNAPNVCVALALDGADSAFADKGASMGVIAGMWSVRYIQENLGSVEVQNPPAAFKGSETYALDSDGLHFPSALLVDGTDVSTLAMAVQNDLDAKGYIFAGSFADFAGFYLSGCPTACSLQNDYAHMNHNSVWNAAARVARAAIIPKTRSVLKLDGETGNLTPTTAEALAIGAQKGLDSMVAAGNCSAAKIAISTDQKPSETEPLKATLEVLLNGILFTAEIDINLVGAITI